ncbi:MAG TPA: glycosyltransferase family 4 protein [bacterium]|nr:glycosyltransferase family 4 protein [bacterium]
MFKIAFIGQKGIPITQGGVERHVEELSLRLSRNGYDVYVYTRPHFVPKEYKKYDNVNLISLPSLRTKNFDAISHTFLATLHAVFKLKADVIHYQGVGPSILSWLPKILNYNIKVVTTVHSADWDHQKWSFFAKFMLELGAKFACKFADETIAVSRSLQKYCLSRNKGEATYIPNGVPLPDKNNELADKVLAGFNLEKQQYLLVVSRLIKHKGVHYLIEAFKRLKDRDGASKKMADLKLVIVGSTAFTENYQKFLLKLTRDRKDIIFTGIQTGANLDALYRNCYLYAQPSESEGLSISVLEAMSYGKAVLVSDIEENLELISGNAESGSVGFDFQNKNVNDLAQKIAILYNNPQIVHQVGAKARNHVKLYYNWEEITTRTEKIYKNIVLVKDRVKKFSPAFSLSSERA